MRTRLGRLPDGRIFCGYVLTQNCCRAIYTHPSVCSNPSIRVTRSETTKNSLYFGDTNRVSVLTTSETPLDSKWYLPSIAEAIVLTNLVPYYTYCKFPYTPFFDLAMRRAVTCSKVNVPFPPQLHYRIISSTCVTEAVTYLDRDFPPRSYKVLYGAIPLDGSSVMYLDERWLTPEYLCQLVQSERVEL